MFRIFQVRASGNSLQSRLRGGEGGIRTLGTGVSPYNGLANSARPLPIAWNQSLTFILSALVRVTRGTSVEFMHLNMHPFQTTPFAGLLVREVRIQSDWFVSYLSNR